MKKLTFIAGVAVLLCVAAVVCISISYNRGQAAEREAEREMEKRGEIAVPGGDIHYGWGKPKELREYPWYVRDSLMPQQSEQFESAGFSIKELIGYEIGNVFSVFVFDADGQLLPESTVMACPITVDQKYIGKAVVTYDESTNRMSKELHKDTLLADIAGGTVDTTAVLTLGKLGSKTFVTDGVNLDILAVDSEPHPDDLSDSELKALAATFKAAAGETYSYVCGYFITVQPIAQ